MAAKATKRKGKTKICEKLKEVDEVLDEQIQKLKLIKDTKVNKEEANGGTGQDTGETDCVRS